MEEEIRPDNSADVNSNVFNGSLGLIGVCLTVVSLFQITDKRALSRMDECLCLATFVFLLSALFAYFSMRKNNHKRLFRFADIFFTIGLMVILFAGVIMLMEL